MQVRWLPTAIRDLQTLREFLRPHNPDASRRAVATIRKVASALEAHPYLGKEAEDLQNFYDIIIPLGVRSYILRYRVHGETIFIVALRHGREVGFPDE